MDNKENNISDLFSGTGGLRKGFLDDNNPEQCDDEMLKLLIKLLEEKLQANIRINNVQSNDLHKHIHYLNNDEINKNEREKMQLNIQNINIQNINIGNERKVEKSKVETFIGLFNILINLVKVILDVMGLNNRVDYKCV